MQDASVEVVRQMVRYMYTAKVEHDFDRIKELLVLANKYQVKCQWNISSEITTHFIFSISGCVCDT